MSNGPRDFEYISLDDYIELYRDERSDEELLELRSDLAHYRQLHFAGTKCDVCDGEIWIIGSAACGWPGCFPCIAGEADASEDYEIL
jgi:hypothetical protein